MKKITMTLEELEIIHEFLKAAMDRFKENPEYFSVSNVERGQPNCFMALRGGLSDSCIEIVKIDETFTPIRFDNILDLGRKEKCPTCKNLYFPPYVEKG